MVESPDIDSPEPVPAASRPVEEVISRGSDGRVKYPESYAEYGRRFGKSARTIRSWVSHGESLEPPVLPPLHDPEQLVTWFRSYRSSKVPPGIINAAEGEDLLQDETPVSEEKKSRESDSQKDSSPTEPHESILLELSDDIEADEGLKQARTLSQLAWKEMKKAYELGNRTKAREWKKDWMEAVRTQRSWEKDINKIMEDRGHLLRKSTLVAEMISMAASIARNVVNGLIELIDWLVLEATEDELAALRADRKARRTLALKFRDRIFAKLRSSKFSNSFREGIDSEDD